MKQQLCLLLCGTGLATTLLYADSLVDLSPDSDSVEMYLATEDGPGKYIGTIEVQSNQYGIVFNPSLSSLEPGMHGFHVHADPSCEPNEKDAEHEVEPAGKAGAHFDPKGVDTHAGPWGVGHIGDLPNLYVDEQGAAKYPVLAPRLEWEFLKGRSLVIHANADNYTDSPPNGGSGRRVACGILLEEELEVPVEPE